MAIEVGEQVRVVWDDAACVQDSFFGSAQRVSAATAIFWISVDIRISVSPELLGVVFGAQAVFHAWACWVQGAAWSMYHASVHKAVQVGLCDRVGELSGN
eukprot:9233305-Pyramimonas_sp.AAC.1